VSPDREWEAYGDHPLPIGHGQTISQPYMVACMTEALSLGAGTRVLEVGTGSGYQTAVLAEIAAEVFTVERIPALARRARELLETLGYRNIRFRVGDGSLGWEENAPYDGILVGAATPVVPVPLKAQLADNGTLVVPVGEPSAYQEIVRVLRQGAVLREERGIGCRFVPLIGAWGVPDRADGDRGE
jgi:protein-L-isoaspartate(D-aspartate) O-methyltransferase